MALLDSSAGIQNGPSFVWFLFRFLGYVFLWRAHSLKDLPMLVVSLVYSSSLSMVCIYHNIFVHSAYESRVLRHGGLDQFLTSGFRTIWSLFLHIYLMFSCPRGFLFVHHRLPPEIYPETYWRHYLSSLFSSTCHRLLHTTGIYWITAVLKTVSHHTLLPGGLCPCCFFCLECSFSANSCPPLRNRLVRKVFLHNIPVWDLFLELTTYGASCRHLRILSEFTPPFQSVQYTYYRIKPHKIKPQLVPGKPV